VLEQVGAGVAGDAQLGEDDDGGAFALGALQEREDLLDVVSAVGDAHHGRRGGDAQETVLEHGSLAHQVIVSPSSLTVSRGAAGTETNFFFASHYQS
jgi:hypothetical protein